MNFSEMDGDTRRILIDTTQVYEAFLQTLEDARRYRGGMRWKKTAGKDYLFRTWGRRGYGRGLGPRSPETEEIFAQFHGGKKAIEQRKDALQKQIVRQARFCIATGVNRVPKITANIIRLLDNAGVMGHGLTILGTNAIFAYEVACGVLARSSLLATGDIDLLFDSRAKLRMVGQIDTAGLIGILRKVDRSFEIQARGHFRAVNQAGFVVEMVKPVPIPPQKIERQTLSGASDDLVAAEMEGFLWLQNAPKFVRIAISEDGFPVRMHVPDPRFFALNKLWVGELSSRNPLKRSRDREQAEMVIQLAEGYLNLSFDDPALRVFPQKIRNRINQTRPPRQTSPR